MEFGEIMVYAMFIIPAIFGIRSAAKGARLEDTLARCERCGMMISASASVCPHCRKVNPFVSRGGMNYHNKSKRKADSNTPMFRFIVTYLLVLFLEFIGIGILGGLVG